MDDEMLSDFSTLLNRLAGMADEMSSYFRRIKQQKLEAEKNPSGIKKEQVPDGEMAPEKVIGLDEGPVKKKERKNKEKQKGNG